MYYVYMLRCRDGSLYTGTAADLCRRMRQHAGGGSACARYTPGPIRPGNWPGYGARSGKGTLCGWNTP